MSARSPRSAVGTDSSEPDLAGPGDAEPGQRPGFRPMHFQRIPPQEMMHRAEDFLREMTRRRSVRQFSSEPVPRRLIEMALRTAATAPSGAHQQPWSWVVVEDASIRARIRAAAEEEERRFYETRAPAEWLEALAPLGTDFVKTHLTDAPWLIVLFRHLHGVGPAGERRTFYYTQESCGIAAGFFIAAIHRMGLATLTHTPSPMGFLREILGRPENEKPFLLLPVGFPAAGAEVPDLERRPLEEISVWL
jgi:iodotyrosine deiodinase